MSETKPIQLQDLDRDELLELFQRLSILRPSQHDILFAQWKVASKRALAALDKVIDHCRTVIALSKEVDAATVSTTKYRRMLGRYLAARQQERRLEEARTRLERRADRLYARMKATPHDRY